MMCMTGDQFDRFGDLADAARVLELAIVGARERGSLLEGADQRALESVAYELSTSLKHLVDEVAETAASAKRGEEPSAGPDETA